MTRLSAPALSVLVVLSVAACSSTDDASMGSDTSAAGQGGSAGGPSGLTGAGAGFTTTDLPPGVQPGSQEDLEISVGDRVYFDYDSAVLNNEAIRILDGQAAWLLGHPGVNVTIAGHADERGTREYNLALGDRRANAVRNYLIALDVPATRILTISYGEERPAVPGSNEQAYSQNRRAVTVVNVTN